jgi:hypothetical protein
MDNSFNFALHILAALLMTLAYKIGTSKLSPFLFFLCMPSLHVYEVDLLSGFEVADADNEGGAFVFCYV